jgi:signal transduction histidine kinase
MAWQASALADRIHNDVLQHLGAAMLKAELCEHLFAAELHPGVLRPLRDLREMLEHACLELRGVMAELRSTSAQ